MPFLSTSVKSPSDSKSAGERLVPIAEIARPHGVLGELRLKVYNTETEMLGRGRAVVIEPASGGAAVAARIARVRETSGALLVTLEGVTGRDAAEALRGARVLCKRSEFPDLPDGEFYACDVEGARAELANGDEVGTVIKLASYPTCDVLVIRKLDGTEVEVPLVDGVVESVDVVERRVRVSSLDEL